ncbi:MAG TPA: transketolase [Candidatus Limnocylindrales bacterium]|nr:transketolase [Candidatus Limnocylindrales bacterium]
MTEELTPEKLKDLKLKANEVRKLLIEELDAANKNSGAGHTGGPLGMADIFTAMYFHVLKHDPKNPDWVDRDRLILSNGHICPIRYASMAQAGYFPIDELKTLRQIGTRLQGHPHRTALPGVENTSGPLGEGISQAAGIALAGRLDKKDYFTYVLTSDGEHQEGNIWEAVMFAAKLKLNNLIQVIDFNNIQIDGPVADIMPLEPFRAKYEAFNWHVIDVDGNDIKAFIDAIREAQNVKNKPTIIIAHTVPGKGVSYMEGNYKWHGMPPGLKDVDGAPSKDEQVKVALDEIETEKQRIVSEN